MPIYSEDFLVKRRWGTPGTVAIPVVVLPPFHVNAGQAFAPVASAAGTQNLIGPTTGPSAVVTAPAVSLFVVSSGHVVFTASPDHASVLNYEIRVWTYPGATSAAIVAAGVPTPDGQNLIDVDLTSTFAGLPAGGYTVSVAATTVGGETESSMSAPFSLPIA